jgi:holdfast attachment protein HfaA
MRNIAIYTAIVAATAFGSLGVAHAANLGDSSSYNTPFGMTSQAQENQAINPSLRDANGNLTVVDGQFTSSAFASGYALAGASANASGVGMANSVNGTTTGSSSGAAYSGATAIGNQLNVVTVGNGNTVLVNSQQTNNGNQTATVNTNGQ